MQRPRIDHLEDTLKQTFLFLLAVGAAIVPARASSIVYYSDKTMFGNATSGATTLDFEGIAPPSVAVPESGGLTVGGVTMAGYNLGTATTVPYLYAIDSLYHPNPAPYPRYEYDRGTGASIQGPDADPDPNVPAGYSKQVGDGMLITLPGAGSTAFGADWWALFFEKSLVPTATFQLTFLNGANIIATTTFQTKTYNASNLTDGVQFFGATSDTQITQVFVTSLGGSFAPSSFIEMDNLTFGTAAVTAAPEPASVVLLAAGLAGIAVRRRRRA